MIVSSRSHTKTSHPSKCSIPLQTVSQKLFVVMMRYLDGSIIKVRDQFIQEFSDISRMGGAEFVFDLSTEVGERDFNLVKNVLEEVVYAKWGKQAAKQLQQRSSPLAATQGGNHTTGRLSRISTKCKMP